MNPVFLAVDLTLDAAPYAQIIEQIRGFIERGDLKSDDTLPTVRQLAGDLGVAPNTVARAYTELAESGWITSEGRRGTRVASQTPATDRRARSRALHEAVSHFLSSLAHRGYSADEVVAELRRVKGLS
ncbi:MAG: GntR family transcriptional regulator [Vulcanimicrobiaceae bacterium]